jgi:AcrR family transcriptional regulator
MYGAQIVNTSWSDLENASTTKDRFTLSAIALFSEKWYGTVSVAEICRRAGFSNGLFYRYFHDKESIFRHILEFVIQKISAEIEDLPGKTADERLNVFVQRIFDFSQKHAAMVKVFREGQYRFFEYEKRLKAVYEDALMRIFGKRPSLSTYLFALGGLRFAATRKVFQDIPTHASSILTILRHGLFATYDIRPAKVFSTSISPLPLEIMPAPRERILREGKILLGRQGYYDTNIHEITSAADLSTGAFYTYFDNKEAFFAELIHRVGREVRRFISINLEDSLNPLERELRGLWLFIVYLSLDRNCYSIVREAEFVLPGEVKQYYGAFVKGYRQRLLGFDLADSTTGIEFMLGIAHYLGIEVVFDHSPENAKNIIAEIGELYRTGFGILGASKDT